MAEGLIIEGKKRSQWKVGSWLGKGEFGQVYALEPVSTSNDNSNANGRNKWVIKVCPIPKGNNKKALKISNSLHYESMLYRNNLPQLQGKELPKLPNPDKPDPIAFHEHAGFKYLVIERMEHSFWSVVRMLVPPKAAVAVTKKIAIGPIAARLVTILQAIHNKGYLVVDVKPENFMFAFGSKKDSGTSIELATRLRLLDLGLVECYRGLTDKHRPNEPTTAVVGTPLYASLNVHGGSTVSRRDDLEAVGYIIAELVIRLVAALNGNEDEYENGEVHSYLPWSTATSDEALGKMKKDNVTSKLSTFYARMGHGKTSEIIHEYLSRVGKTPYQQEPDYDELCALLQPLTVEVGHTKVQSGAKVASTKKVAASKKALPAKVASPKKAPSSTAKLPRSPLVPCSVVPAQPTATDAQPDAKPAAIRRSNRRKHADEDDFEFDEDAPRHKKAIVKMDKSQPKVVPFAEMNVDAVNEIDSFLPKTKKTLVKMDKSKPAAVNPTGEALETEDMDVDSIYGSCIDESMIDDDVDAPQHNAAVLPNKKSCGMIEIEVKEGPRAGERFVLKTHETEVITIGSAQPRAAGKSTSKTESFPGDARMAPRHVQLKLLLHRGNPRVEVKDLKSGQETWVSLQRLEPGKTTTIFPGASIQVGATKLVVSRGISK